MLSDEIFVTSRNMQLIEHMQGFFQRAYSNSENRNLQQHCCRIFKYHVWIFL